MIVAARDDALIRNLAREPAIGPVCCDRRHKSDDRVIWNLAHRRRHAVFFRVLLAAIDGPRKVGQTPAYDIVALDGFAEAQGDIGLPGLHVGVSERREIFKADLRVLLGLNAAISGTISVEDRTGRCDPDDAPLRAPEARSFVVASPPLLRRLPLRA